MTQQRPPGSKPGKPQGQHRHGSSKASGSDRPKFGDKREGGPGKTESRFGGAKIEPGSPA